MTTERLTTLAAVKDWLGIDTSDSDAGLLRVIDAASRFTLNYLSRPTLKRASYTWNFVGNGKEKILLPNWPVLEITSVGIGSAVIPRGTFNAANMGPGWYLAPMRPGYQELSLYGYGFYRNIGCEVVYVAGFETNETVTVPADAPHEIQVSSVWSENSAVYLDGTLAVAVDGTPTVGQYSFSDTGLYTFAAADAGKLALIHYGYVPDDIAFVVTETVGEWFKRKDRIGLLSKTLAGGVSESITFSKQALGDAGIASLQPYRNII